MNSLILERIQIAEGILPLNLTTARTGRVVSMRNYRRMGILFYKGIGTAGQDPTLTILQGTDIAFGTNQALNFAKIWVKQDLTKLSDVAQWTLVERTGGSITNTYTDATSAEQAAMWWVEFQQSDLDIANGYDCIRASIGDVGTNEQLGSILYFGADPIYPAAPENMLGMVAD